MKIRNLYVKSIRILRGNIINLLYGLKTSGLRVEGKLNISRPHNKTKIIMGKNILIYKNVGIFLDADNAIIEIGDDSYINRRSEICCKSNVKIGKKCAISWDVTITDTDYHGVLGRGSTKPVIIGDRVWIGCKSTILKGVTIGEGSVVAAGSLVVDDVPKNCLVAGVPAKVIKRDIKWS